MSPLGRPPWFKAIVWVEVLGQLPFFAVALYAWLYRREWVRVPAIVYGAHVATTLVPILGHFMGAAIPTAKLQLLLAFYAPYLLVPLWLVARSWIGVGVDSAGRTIMFERNLDDAGGSGGGAAGAAAAKAKRQ